MRLPFARRSFLPTVAILFLTGIIAISGSTEVLAQPYYYAPPPSYYQNDTAAGTVAGGALGAVTGAMIGGRDNRGEGALIGLGVGALTGNLMGRAKDRADEQRAAYGAAAVGQMNQQVAAQAVTNYDLQEMTRAGVSEDVIISTMRSRGTRLDLSPSSLIALKQAGVSDRVVLAAQSTGPTGPAVVGPAPILAPAPVVHMAPPPAVIVAPAPWGCYGPPRHYYHRPHTHIHYGFHF